MPTRGNNTHKLHKAKHRRQLSDEERIKITLERVARLKQLGKWPHNSDLGTFFHRHPSMISKVFMTTLRDGLVELTIPSRPPPRPQRNPDLQKALRSRFPQLLDIVVINAEQSRFSAPSSIMPPIGLPDDTLHESLGEAMAEYITSGPQVFGDSSVIGVGSGRGVGYTVEALRKIVPLPFRTTVTIMSLTGSVHSRHSQRRFWLDADTHAALLTTCFDREVTLNLIRHPLTYDSDTPEHTVDMYREKTPLGLTNWRDTHPTHALVGVGILAEGHRFFSEATATPKDQEPLLAPIHVLLSNLVTLSQRIAAPKYTPVADMSNYLFYVPPPKGVTVPSGTEDDIRSVIDKINRKLITVREEQLSTINTLMLVAGTAQKATAIRELLVNPKYHVRYLCTDEEAANNILEITAG